MARSSWGGAQDLSGVFSSLLNADFQNQKAGIQKTLNDARSEQNANDTVMQERWKAGKISDDEWLDYIRKRISETTDPERRAQWQQILLQNQDAISDAQWETKFQENKITVSQLMQHYRTRMGGVDKNSPAYRDLASRMSELSQFQQSGGVHYNDQFKKSGGGGGGSRGGSAGSKKASELQSAYDAITGTLGIGLEGGPTDIGYRGGEVYNTSGPSVVDTEFGTPASDTRSALFTTAMDGLIATQKELEGLFKFIEDNPDEDVYTFPGSGGRIIQLTPEAIRAADNQYLRTTETLAAIAIQKGDGSEAQYQLNKAGTFASTTMRDHNLGAAEGSLDSVLIEVKAQFALASQESDPTVRRNLYKQINRQIDSFVSRAFPDSVVKRARRNGFLEGIDPGETTSSPSALQNTLPDNVSASLAAIRQASDIGAYPDNYSDQAVSDFFDEATAAEDLGSGAFRIVPSDLYGGGGPNATMGDGFLGAGDARLDFMGLRNAKLLRDGVYTIDEMGDAPLRTYQWNAQKNKVEIAEAVAQPQADGSVQVLPAVSGPGGVTAAPNAVGFITEMGGESTQVFAPINSGVPVSGYVYRFSDKQTITINRQSFTYEKGDLVPSSVLASLGENGLRQYNSNGLFYKDAPPGTSQASIGGRTWFYDQRLNTWSPVPPWNLTLDQTDPNAIEVSDPQYMNNSNGGFSVDKNLTGGDSTLVSMAFVPGLPGYVVPFAGITQKKMQQWLNAEVAAGRIDPNDYMLAAPDGSDEAVALGDKYMSLYYDQEYETQLRQAYESSGKWNPKTTIDMQKLQQQKAIREWQQSNIPANQRGFWKGSQADAPTDPGTMIQNQIDTFAATLGIRTGTLVGPARRAEQRGATTGDVNPYNNYGPGIRDFQRDALMASASRGHIAKQPKLEPLPAAPRAPLRAPFESANPVPSLKAPSVPPLTLGGFTAGLTAAQKAQQRRNFRERP